MADKSSCFANTRPGKSKQLRENWVQLVLSCGSQFATKLSWCDSMRVISSRHKELALGDTPWIYPILVNFTDPQ
jgi:hypothetical protein